MNTEKNKPTKQPYHPPQVYLYGNVRDLTKAAANKSATGDGGVGKDKTS